jgi:hypothetical protein
MLESLAVFVFVAVVDELVSGFVDAAADGAFVYVEMK